MKSTSVSTELDDRAADVLGIGVPTRRTAGSGNALQLLSHRLDLTHVPRSSEPQRAHDLSICASICEWSSDAAVYGSSFLARSPTLAPNRATRCLARRQMVATAHLLQLRRRRHRGRTGDHEPAIAIAHAAPHEVVDRHLNFPAAGIYGLGGGQRCNGSYDLLGARGQRRTGRCGSLPQVVDARW